MREKKLLHATAIMPKVTTEIINPKYAPSTSYSETPPSGKHNITSDVEVIPIQKVNEAYDRVVKSDVKYRFSIDMASLKSE